MPRASDNSILAVLQRMLQHPDVHAEVFFPIEHCEFDTDRLRLNPERKKQAASSICGIRLTAARIDEHGGASSDTRACQADVGHLVQSLARLRQEPELDTTVMSKQGLRCRANGEQYSMRVRVGLECGSARFRDDRKAARVCHRRIVSQIRAAGFRVTEPASFDDRTGFEGLANWADHLRLERRRPWWLIVPLILLLGLLPLIPSCRSRATFAGLPVTTRGTVILLDKSGSMGSSFPDVKRETQRLLTERKQEGFRTCVDFGLPHESWALS